MKRLTRIMIMSLAALLIVANIAACGSGKDLAKIQPPSYEEGSRFWIGAWNPPTTSVDDYKFAADMGITHMFVNDVSQKTRDCLQESGLKGIMQGQIFPSESRIESLAANNYLYPEMEGILWWDEPDAATVATRINEAAYLHEEAYGDDLLFFVNLFPNWAMQYFGDRSWREFLEFYYDMVLSQVSGRKMLSYDFYPLIASRGGERSMRGDWLVGLQELASFAKERDTDVHVFIQAAEHFGTYPVMTEEELRFQFAVYLTFGITNFSYFQYTVGAYSNGFYSALVRNDRSCSPFPLYYGAKQVGAELKSLEHVYMNYEWLGSMPLKGTETAIDEDDGEMYDQNMDFDGIDSIPFVNKVQATQNTILGRFRDKNGAYNGLMVTNFTQPSDELDDTVEIEFKDAKKVAVYTMGEEKVYVLKKNTLKIQLEPGQGAFMIPLA